MPFRQSFSGDVFIAVPQLCSNISRSFLLLLFLFLFLSLFIFIYLRQSLCCVPCNASWNFKWNGVFSFLFYTYSLLLLSFTPLSLSLFLSLARSLLIYKLQYLLVSTIVFLLSRETRRLVCRSDAWECLRLQQGGRPANSTPIKNGGSVCTRLFYYFPFPCPGTANNE